MTQFDVVMPHQVKCLNAYAPDSVCPSLLLLSQ